MEISYKNSIKKTYSLFFIFGDSMFPALKDGSKVIINRDQRDFNLKDIVVFRKNKFYICHRIIKIEKKYGRELFYLKGDFSRGVDIIEKQDIAGKVVAVVRGGRIENISFFTTPFYFRFSQVLFFLKIFSIKTLDFIYSFKPARSLLKKIVPLKAEVSFYERADKEDAFRLFASFCERGFPSQFGGSLAKRGRKIIGKLLFFRDKERSFFLSGPYVKTLYRGRGVGKSLLEEVLKNIRKETSSIYALIPLKGPVNYKALFSFYKKAGFVLDKREKNRVSLKYGSLKNSVDISKQAKRIAQRA